MGRENCAYFTKMSSNFSQTDPTGDGIDIITLLPSLTHCYSFFYPKIVEEHSWQELYRPREIQFAGKTVTSFAFCPLGYLPSCEQATIGVY